MKSLLLLMLLFALSTGALAEQASSSAQQLGVRVLFSRGVSFEGVPACSANEQSILREALVQATDSTSPSRTLRNRAAGVPLCTSSLCQGYDQGSCYLTLNCRPDENQSRPSDDIVDRIDHNLSSQPTCKESKKHVISAVKELLRSNHLSAQCKSLLYSVDLACHLLE
jgi:hypothetical protein